MRRSSWYASPRNRFWNSARLRPRLRTGLGLVCDGRVEHGIAPFVLVEPMSAQYALALHTDALHDRPGRLVPHVGSGPGPHQLQVRETENKQACQRLGHKALAPELRVHRIANVALAVRTPGDRIWRAIPGSCRRSAAPRRQGCELVHTAHSPSDFGLRPPTSHRRRPASNRSSSRRLCPSNELLVVIDAQILP
jgi:hypothetical protein